MAFYIKKYQEPTKKGLIFPTTLGSVTPLSVISCAFAVYPNYRLFGFKFLPISLIVFGVWAFELRDLLQEEEKRKELCKQNFDRKFEFFALF